MTDPRDAVEAAVLDVLRSYGLEPASVLGAVSSDVYHAVRRAFAEEACAPILAEINTLRVGANEFDRAQAEALEWAVEKLRTLGGAL